MEISQYRLAQSIAVPARRISEIVQEKRAISADTALRLGRFFGTSAEFWMNLQALYDLEMQRTKLGDSLTAVTAYSRMKDPKETRGRSGLAPRPVVATFRSAARMTQRTRSAASRKSAKHR